MLWPLGPISTGLAILMIAVTIWRKPDIRIPAVLLANYFVTAYAKPLGIVAYGLADLMAVVLLCFIGTKRSLSVASFFVFMMIAYVMETNAMIEKTARQAIVELLALGQIVALGVPNGWIMARVDKLVNRFSGRTVVGTRRVGGAGHDDRRSGLGDRPEGGETSPAKARRQ